MTGPLRHGASLGHALSLLTAVLAGSAQSGCERASAADSVGTKPAHAAAHAPTAHAEPAPAPEPAPTRVALAAGQTVSIPAGVVQLGSLPGSAPRDPSREADLVSVQLPAFEMDRLPYPNDPARPPLTQITRQEAADKCDAEGKRLCTEVEWERACKGDLERSYPMGNTWNTAACASERQACDSATGVSDLGLRVREWTASDAAGGLGVSARTAVTRGAIATASDVEHRCAARNAATADSRSDTIGFRCCKGGIAGEHHTTYPTEPTRPLIAPLSLTTDELRATMRGVPELAAHADGFTPLSATDVQRAVARGGRSGDSITWWTLAPSVSTWSPMPGEEIIVLSGRVESGILLAAVYPHEGKWLHGESVLLLDKDSSIAVGARSDDPSSLLWTSAWSRYGESGRLRIGEDGRVQLHFH